MNKEFFEALRIMEEEKGIDQDFLIEKISGATLTRINQAVGFRLITKFGQTGIINLGKMVPLAGGVIGGGFDLVTTKIIAQNALKMFIETTTEGSQQNDSDTIGDN